VDAGAPDFFGGGGAEEEVEFVDGFPHFGGDLVADHAGVFAGGEEAGEDGVGVFAAEGDEVGDGLAVALS